MEERLAQRYPHTLRSPGQQETDPQVAATPLPAAQQAGDETREALKSSEMPAIEESGRLVKTIEHYAFADGEDTVSFIVHFDRDLWDGAAKHVDPSRVKVNASSTSLEIQLQGVPVAPGVALETVADWRLSLAPLFSRVEPRTVRQRLRNGKLTVSLAKAKLGSWKKGVK